jgi:hypothetical protein
MFTWFVKTKKIARPRRMSMPSILIQLRTSFEDTGCIGPILHR